MNDSQCSELFSDVFDSHCGGCVRTCECGITHFNVDYPSDFDEGELEELKEKEKEFPDKYKSGDGSIGTIEIGGRQIVWGCSCEIARQYEDFILGDAIGIAEYLNKRAEMLRKKADGITVRGSDDGMQKGS